MVVFGRALFLKGGGIALDQHWVGGEGPKRQEKKGVQWAVCFLFRIEGYERLLASRRGSAETLLICGASV